MPGARCECLSKLCFDIRVEGGPVHGVVYHPGGNKSLCCQSGNEGLGFPPAKRSRAIHPLTNRASPIQAGHVGFGRRLIDKDKALRLLAHFWLAGLLPFLPGLAHS